MRMSDRDLKDALAAQTISITPAPREEDFGPVSIDLHLGDQFRTFAAHQTPFIDVSEPSKSVTEMIDRVMGEPVTIPPQGRFVIHPGDLALGVTQERVAVPNHLVGWLDGRSTLARLGLLVHVTAHRIDPGFDGRIVLEFVNAGRLPLALAPGMAIGAISFEVLTSPCAHNYQARSSSRYVGQEGPVSSRP